MSEKQKDPELSAIESVMKALEPLKEESRKRVIAYVLSRLDIAGEPMLLTRLDEESSIGEVVESVKIDSRQQSTDIRSLKEQKAPTAAIEMAVLIAYYLSELAPIEGRKSTINTGDLEIYFKQAKFRLPKSIQFVLPNAKKGGYMETVSKGEYRLNSVGYNLAVHGLPKTKSK